MSGGPHGPHEVVGKLQGTAVEDGHVTLDCVSPVGCCDAEVEEGKKAWGLDLALVDPMLEELTGAAELGEDDVPGGESDVQLMQPHDSPPAQFWVKGRKEGTSVQWANGGEDPEANNSRGEDEERPSIWRRRASRASRRSIRQSTWGGDDGGRAAIGRLSHFTNAEGLDGAPRIAGVTYSVFSSGSTRGGAKKLLGDIIRRQGSAGETVGADGDVTRLDSSNISERVLGLVSFNGCEELLRGCPLQPVLRRGARIFQNSGGSAATYELSEPTESIDAFISHNWSVPRFRKYLCLVSHFNFWIALWLSLAFCLSIGVFNVLGYFPTTTIGGWSEYPRGYVATFLVTPFWLLVMGFVRDLPRWLMPFQGPTVFLDKVCIHQENIAIQKRSIEKLGAFLCHSETMVICYTDVYLTKLWTVYEVASFLSLYPASKMRVIPVLAPAVFFSGIILLYLLASITMLMNIFGVNFYYLEQVISPFAWYGFIIVGRRWMKSKAQIKERLSTFTVHQCICFVEEDRPVVYSNIAELMRETQGLDDDCSEMEALAVFDQLVRSELSTALLHSLGSSCLRYSQLTVMCGLLYCSRIVDSTTMLIHGADLRFWACSYFVWYLGVVFIMAPMVMVSLDFFCGRMLHLQGVCQVIWNVAGCVMTVGMMAVFVQVWDTLAKWAADSTLWFGVYLLVFFLAVPTMFFVHRRRNPFRCLCRRGGLDDGGDEDEVEDQPGLVLQNCPRIGDRGEDGCRSPGFNSEGSGQNSQAPASPEVASPVASEGP